MDNFYSGEVYNLGGNPDREIDIRELSDLILDHLDMDGSLVTYEEKEEMTTDVKRINSSKARRQLNHELTVPTKRMVFS
ncbi:hypothetical protein [Haladaptatus sp. NG-SE-30]